MFVCIVCGETLLNLLSILVTFVVNMLVVCLFVCLFLVFFFFFTENLDLFALRLLNN